ncbi:hypothetical protein VTH8203_02553 [Vibrio thalassae]|uniref:Uncharacterized protein n=1 Tax=Vibrio thalassae TaxID=1243014 RepID=A0A240EK15_9VIBR|nr:hypothetical protein [Vibrio thalassae]SNX48916.1 hypothetical protein VTH8203_02553 [Vibrio thalassae]
MIKLLTKLLLLPLALLASLAFANDYEVTKSRKHIFKSPDEILPELGDQIGSGFGWGREINRYGEVKGEWLSGYNKSIGQLLVFKVKSPDNDGGITGYGYQESNKDRNYRLHTRAVYDQLPYHFFGVSELSTCKAVFQVKHYDSNGELTLYDILVLSLYHDNVDPLCGSANFDLVHTTEHWSFMQDHEQHFTTYLSIESQYRDAYGTQFVDLWNYGWSETVEWKYDYWTHDAVTGTYCSDDNDPCYPIEGDGSSADYDFYEDDDNCVTFYSEPNKKGKKHSYCLDDDGNGQYFDLALSDADNTFTSLRVGKNVKVTHYHDSRSGWTWTQDSDVNSFNQGTNNRISSLEVFPKNVKPTCVRLWTKQNIQGRHFDHCMDEQYYGFASFSGTPENNNIESLEVGKDVKAVLWNGDKNRTFLPSLVYSKLGEFSNRAQSLEIYPFDNALEPTCVRLWTKENFDGQPFEHCMTNGFYFHVNFAGLVENNSIKSMEVGKNVKAVLWNGDKNRTFLPSHDYSELGEFRNRAQSLEIYPSN